MKWHQQLNITSRSNCLDLDSRPTYMALSLWKLTWSPTIIWFLSTFMSVTLLALKMTQIDEIIDYFWTIPPELRPPGKSYVARTLTDHEMASTYNDWDPGVHETLSQCCFNVSSPPPNNKTTLFKRIVSVGIQNKISGLCMHVWLGAIYSCFHA